MPLCRQVLFGVILACAPAMAHAQVAFHGVGDLPGGPALSVVRDATKAGGIIYAVGGSAANPQVLCLSPNNPVDCVGVFGPDTATLWTWDGNNGLLTPLPNFSTNMIATSPIFAASITPDAAYIAGQFRSGPGAQAQRLAGRVTTNGLFNLNLNTALSPSFTPPTAATAISYDGSILYGAVNIGSATSPVNGAVRFDVNSGSATLIAGLAGASANVPASRGTSSDGSVMVGTSSTPTGARAFRFVHGTGASAIPVLAGGNFNRALAVSPDGNLTLVGGNSQFFPHGEVYLYDTTVPGHPTISALGSPNTPWGPSSAAGMTSDGKVVAISFFGGGARHSYFHNDNGWFLLTSALGKGNVDVATEGWNTITMQVTGMSSDGTLVFGQGEHNGVPEGFVAEFPPNFLASFSAAPGAPANTAIVGAWLFSNPPNDQLLPDDPAVLTMLADGTYFLMETFPTPADAEGDHGIERGTYTWNASSDDASGPFSVTTLLNTKGDSGFSDANGLLGQTASLSGNTNNPRRPQPHRLKVHFPATANDGRSNLIGARITLGPGSIVGGWVSAVQENLSVLVLREDGTFYEADANAPDASGNPGVEKGTYSWDPVTHVFSADTITVDTNGQRGFSDAPATTFQLSPDGLVITGTDAGGSFFLNRIVDPNGVAPVITSSLSVTGALGTPFNYAVTTAWPALSILATGLPAGLTINATTGVISGTPRTLGSFDVALSASNTLSTAGATLHLVITNAIAVGPTDLWIGVKTAADAGTSFDLLVEVFKNGVLVTSRQLNGVSGGSNGFNSAVSSQVGATFASPTTYGAGNTLSVRVSARIAATSGRPSGTARLWFNDGAANTHLETIVNGVPQSFYLRSGFALSPAAGPGPKSTSDVLLDRAVGGNPFKAFGTWTITF